MAKQVPTAHSNQPDIVVALHTSLKDTNLYELPPHVDGRRIKYIFTNDENPKAAIHVANSTSTALCFTSESGAPISNVCAIVGNIRKCGIDQNNLPRTGAGFYALPTFHQGFSEYLVKVIRAVCKTNVSQMINAGQTHQAATT